MQNKIAVSVIVVTKNEERNMPRCLAALERFDEVVVVDSGSTDKTKEIAVSFGASFEPFVWNGHYPKKRQWCLDTLTLKHDRVFFVDADEEVTPDLCDAIFELDWKASGYFVKGAYVVNGATLRYGLKNNKLCLFDRRKVAFPVVNDLDLPGMGEMEGHYQPVIKSGTVGGLKNFLLHHAGEDQGRYAARHEGYRRWESGMRARKAYPAELTASRRAMKAVFAALPCKAMAAFLHSYVVLGGFLDGRGGLIHARNRFDYYRSIESSGKARV